MSHASSTIKRSETTWNVVSMVVAALEVYHPLLNHMWLLMGVSLTNYMSRYRNEADTRPSDIHGWLWSYRYSIATAVLFTLCMLVDQAFGDDGYVSLAFVLLAALGTIMIRRAAMRIGLRLS